MQENSFFLFKETINKTIALELFRKKIYEDERFISNIVEDLLTIEEKYIGYYFIEASIHNHPYFYKNKITNEYVDGKIDIHESFSDPEFILNELQKADAKEIEERDFIYVDEQKHNKLYKEFIQNIKDKALYNITLKHNKRPSKSIHIDIAPLDGFHTYSCTTYLEKVYIFRYRNLQKKTDFISILSGYNQMFYELDFVKSEKYLEYLTKFKRPIQYIPKDFVNFYYIDSFDIYNLVTKRLEYESYKGILKKIRNNINYEDYSLYNEYLKSGIYYYKIPKYLKKLKIEERPLKYRIYLSYLTLKYQMSSGLFLYQCAKLGLLLNHSLHEQIRLLNISYKLGSLEAKKKLYEHYSLPLYYDEAMVKKYS